MIHRNALVISGQALCIAAVAGALAGAAGCSVAGPAPDRGPGDPGVVLAPTQPGLNDIGPLPQGHDPAHVIPFDPGAFDPAGGSTGETTGETTGQSTGETTGQSTGETTGETTSDPAQCDPSIQIQPDSPALIVTDAAALQALPFEKVIAALDWNPENRVVTVQRLFDTLNDGAGAVTDAGFHCDSAFSAQLPLASSTSCPRPEGALAESEGFFTDGDPDQFVPVAAVNRFDLRASPDDLNCGEFRLIYAKASGKTNPDDRVFLIFEAAVPRPGGLFGEDACYSFLKAWKAVADAPDPATRGAILAELFLTGLPNLDPIITRANLGQSFFGGGYHGAVTSGRIRLSLHSGADWEWHEVRLVDSPFGGVDFQPLPVASTPAQILFEPSVWEANPAFRTDFMNNQLLRLAKPDVDAIVIAPAVDHLAGDSPLGPSSDYSSMGAKNLGLLQSLQVRIDGFGYGGDCPADDPFTPDSVLRRVTANSCAGCHAPAHFFGPERKVGCGVRWPAAQGVHIDEQGNLSPALKEIHLPRRARNLQKHLHGCVDEAAP